MEQIYTNTPQKHAKVKSRYRDRIELLQSRVSLLTGRDKLIMTMHFENGNSCRQIARLVGVNIATVARRIHKLTERLINSEYVICLRNGDRFTKAEMAIARDYFLMGLSIREIVQKYKSNVYRVRKVLIRVRRLATAMDKT
jgi:predicted DNA-binding protein YlxM (UPF0122 family)